MPKFIPIPTSRGLDKGGTFFLTAQLTEQPASTVTKPTVSRLTNLSLACHFALIER